MWGINSGGIRLGSSDAGVVNTNDDAQLSKLSCVRHGYFQDSFVHRFVRRPSRRSPLINRGYYSRYAALRSLLLQFLALGLDEHGAGQASGDAPPPTEQQHVQQQRQQQEQQQQQEAEAEQDEQHQQHGQTEQQGPQAGHQEQQQQQQQHQRRQPVRKQVLVLGAGYDTTYFELAAKGVRADKYIELDFPQVTQKKAAAIQQLPDLLELVGGPEAALGISPEEGRVLTERYCLLPADLRDPRQLAAALDAAGLDPQAPTFVLSECVLVYLPPQHSREVVRWLAEHLQTAALVVYEQIQPHDAFGQQMLLNLESRGCALLGIEATPSLEAHQRRFTECGWHRSEAHTMDHVYTHCIDPQERRRIERLELFDEFEEWHLIQQHYCIALGVKDSTGLLQRFGLPHFSQPAPPQQQQQQRRHPGARPMPPPPPPRFGMST